MDVESNLEYYINLQRMLQRTILVKDDQCTVLYIFWTFFNIQKS